MGHIPYRGKHTEGDDLMATTINAETFTKHIQAGIDEYGRKESGKAIKKAVAQYGVDLRGVVGKLAVQIARQVEFLTMSDRLIIEVRLPSEQSR